MQLGNEHLDQTLLSSSASRFGAMSKSAIRWIGEVLDVGDPLLFDKASGVISSILPA
jgi:hypothetical protein